MQLGKYAGMGAAAALAALLYACSDSQEVNLTPTAQYTPAASASATPSCITDDSILGLDFDIKDAPFGDYIPAGKYIRINRIEILQNSKPLFDRYTDDVEAYQVQLLGGPGNSYRPTDSYQVPVMSTVIADPGGVSQYPTKNANLRLPISGHTRLWILEPLPPGNYIDIEVTYKGKAYRTMDIVYDDNKIRSWLELPEILCASEGKGGPSAWSNLKNWGRRF